VRRNDGDQRIGRALRKLLLKDVGDGVGDDADDDRQNSERSDLLGRRLPSGPPFRID
jgi:hypothetical protein